MQKICLKVATWLVAEIVLNLIGMDDLADYSEYLFDFEVSLGNQHPHATLMIPVNTPHNSDMAVIL